MGPKSEIKIGSRADWLKARTELLTLEKEHTRRGDELARMRQDLPWVPVEKNYLFSTEKGDASLLDLFDGRSQLLIYHFMFGPDFKSGCASCSAIADGFDGIIPHLNHHDVTLAAVSLAPVEKLLSFRGRMGWKFPWASSGATDFNFDFSSSFTQEQQSSGSIEYNYRTETPLREHFEWRSGEVGGGPSAEEQFAKLSGTDVFTYHRERPGMSAFALREGKVYHTYSAYARGLDAIWSMYAWLDRAPLGRNEAGPWWRHHDQYKGNKNA